MLLLPCPQCGRETNRLFEMGGDRLGCRCCARPSAEEMWQRHLQSTRRPESFFSALRLSATKCEAEKESPCQPP
jgi:hypothetical protein